MKTTEQFLAEQAVALEKHKQDIAEFEALGPIPGLSPYLIHGKLYGVRHIAFKLDSLTEFLVWAKENCDDVQAVEGRYRGFYPSIPDTKDYETADIVASGNVVVDYSTIMRRYVAECYTRNYKISFELPWPNRRDMVPRAHFKTDYSDSYRGNRVVEKWTKPGVFIREYLRASVDKQSAGLEMLMYWTDFEKAFVKEEYAKLG